MKELIRNLRSRADQFDYDRVTQSLLRESANELERLAAELDHSEWLRNRSSEVYHRYDQRTGEEIV
jgi:hypothetical protein